MRVSKVLIINDLINSSNGYQYTTELMSQFSDARATASQAKARRSQVSKPTDVILDLCSTSLLYISEIHPVFCDVDLDKKTNLPTHEDNIYICNAILSQLIVAFQRRKDKRLYCTTSCTKRQKSDRDSGKTTKLRCLHRFQLVRHSFGLFSWFTAQMTYTIAQL